MGINDRHRPDPLIDELIDHLFYRGIFVYRDRVTRHEVSYRSVEERVSLLRSEQVDTTGKGDNISIAHHPDEIATFDDREVSNPQ